MFALICIVALLAGANGFRMAPASRMMVRSSTRMAVDPWTPNTAASKSVSMDELK